MALNSPLNTSIDISIIIVNYNLTRELGNCLNSLFENIQTSNLKFEIIIVDNNSPDKDLVELEQKNNYENVYFCYLNKNMGFGKGCNYGYKKASGNFVCFLNPDTIIMDNIFRDVIDLFNSDESIGVIGPKQLTRKPCFDFSAGYFPNIFIELFNQLGIGVFFEGFLIFLITTIGKKKIYNFDWVLGACLFIRSNIFDEINGFDRDYFMFYEEVDLCKRVSNMGYKIIYYPQLEIHHIGSVSGKKDYKLYTIRTYASKNLYISKHYKFVYKIVMKALLFTQIMAQIIICTVLMIKNKNKYLQKIRAFIYLYRNRMQNRLDQS